MKTVAVAIVLCGLAATVVPADAQDRWGFELRTGAAFPTSDLGDADLATGWGFEGTVAFRVASTFRVYGGWDWHRFASDDSFAGADIDFEETGYAFGLLMEQPLASSGTAIRLRAGGTYNHIEVEDDADLTADSGHGLGWEAGAAVVFTLGKGWYLTPGARYRSLSRDLTVLDVTTDVDLRYVALEVGVAKRF
ncbi:MAG: outer membrane beta-barrel protein [Gemmatimonadota bacterium]|nr:outer membrane beta-barrel protein [Gemmatimonadota bacterium]